jgi:hypothetical protein
MMRFGNEFSFFFDEKSAQLGATMNSPQDIIEEIVTRLPPWMDHGRAKIRSSLLESADSTKSMCDSAKYQSAIAAQDFHGAYKESHKS